MVVGWNGRRGPRGVGKYISGYINIYSIKAYTVEIGYQF